MTEFKFGIKYPIESAPRDASRFIICLKNGATGQAFYDDEDDVFYWEEGGMCIDPVFWTPLPDFDEMPMEEG